MVYSCCFSLGGNLDFLQKKFITSTTDLKSENFRSIFVSELDFYFFLFCNEGQLNKRPLIVGLPNCANQALIGRGEKTKSTTLET